MSKTQKIFTSQVGRKWITGITGLGLLLFIIVHLLGNLTYFGGHEAMNRYSHYLHENAWLLYTAELGLLAFFAFHIWIGLSIWWRKRKARPEDYETYSVKGRPSRQGWSARSMAITGVVLLVFVIIHLQTFKWGPAYEVTYDGETMRNIALLVEETFQSAVYTFGYVAVMILLGMHLRHGIWSSFQSLGSVSLGTSRLFHGLSWTLGFLIAIGFSIVPLYIYFSAL